MITFQDTLDAFFDPQDQDAFARSQGWEDAAQMCYYEDLAVMEEQKLHELQQQDAREVYEEQLDWRLLPRTDTAGVY